MSILATDRQVAFIEKLRSERVVPARLTCEPTSKIMASAMITDLLELPQVERNQAGPGYYVTEDNAIFVVVWNRSKTNTYAKRLVFGESRAKWTYAPGASAALAGSVALTAEKAAELGHLHGVCVVCARRLTVPKSVQAGIGPVCARKL